MTVDQLRNDVGKPNYQVHLIIVGAGLAGLGAAITARLEGHAVTVLEKVTELEEVGAGLQVTPNATRLLHYWGVFDELSKKASSPSYLAVRRYDGTRVLAREDGFQEKMIQRYGFPFWDLHRADLQTSLVRRARDLGVEIRLGTEVKHIDAVNAVVTSVDGQSFKGDLILGTDGLWSRARTSLAGREISPKPTGDLAYRIILNAEDLKDPELIELVSHSSVNFWIGPESHVVGYSVRKGRTYNLVLLCPDDLPPDVSKAPGDVEQMRRLFLGWDPILSKLLANVNEVQKWRLMHLAPLETWTNSEGTIAMAGDSCHPMLPYLAQGANSSLEDGAVLGRILRYVSRQEDIPSAIALYESVRKSRGEGIANETQGQRAAFHLPDGPLQEQRDAIFSKYFGKVAEAPFPSRWTCPSIQPWLYGYDAVKEADIAYRENPF